MKCAEGWGQGSAYEPDLVTVLLPFFLPKGALLNDPSLLKVPEAAAALRASCCLCRLGYWITELTGAESLGLCVYIGLPYVVWVFADCRGRICDKWPGRAVGDYCRLLLSRS